mmetsp:Transcript_1837/g.2642  ORF Transcript_1837/g.2642 Transcript_1837/m.2642 type:complete len:295 (-) Transcript_1837:11-895(-)
MSVNNKSSALKMLWLENTVELILAFFLFTLDFLVPPAISSVNNDVEDRFASLFLNKFNQIWMLPVSVRVFLSAVIVSFFTAPLVLSFAWQTVRKECVMNRGRTSVDESTDVTAPEVPVLNHHSIGFVRLWSRWAFVTSISGWALREYAQQILGPKFTYQISDPGNLITTGVYRYLIHPGYTGAFFHITGIGMLAMVALPFGNFIFMSDVQTSAKQNTFQESNKDTQQKDLRQRNHNSTYRIITVYTTCLILWSSMLLQAIHLRIIDEEHMLEQIFDDQWHAHVASRWHLLPFIW